MKIRIYKPHTHAGKRYTPGPDGIELDVKPHDAEFIRRLGLHEKPEAAASPAPARAPVDGPKPNA